MTVEFTEEQEQEIQRRIQEQRIAQMQQDFGKQWFLEALSHTGNLTNQGAFPQEAHQMGQVFFQQFRINTGMEAPVKKEEKKADE